MNLAGDWIQVATFCVVIGSGIGVPFILRNLGKQDSDRQLLRTEMHSRLGHLDQCMDDLKSRVLSETCTRADMLIIKAETLETVNRMRVAISSETHGLHQRIMRLENMALRLHPQEHTDG